MRIITKIAGILSLNQKLIAGGEDEMVIEKKTSLILHCPMCGGIGSDTLQIFAFSGRQQNEVKCECGQLKAICGRNKNMEYWLVYICAICEVEHRVTFRARQFWGKEPLPIICPETGIQLGFICAEKIANLKDTSADNTDILRRAMSNANYFLKPLIVLDVLEQIQELMTNEKIKCSCDKSDIVVDFYPDKVKLVCKNCGGYLMLPVTSKKDYLNLLSLDDLLLVRDADILKG